MSETPWFDAFLSVSTEVRRDDPDAKGRPVGAIVEDRVRAAFAHLCADAAPPGRQPPEPTDAQVEAAMAADYCDSCMAKSIHSRIGPEACAACMAKCLRAALRAASGGARNNIVACVACKQPVEVTAFNAIRCESCRSRASGAAAPPQLGDPGRGSFERGVTCWACPDCAFTFDAGHTDQSANTYTCPLCYPAAPPAGTGGFEPSLYFTLMDMIAEKFPETLVQSTLRDRIRYVMEQALATVPAPSVAAAREAVLGEFASYGAREARTSWKKCEAALDALLATVPAGPDPVRQAAERWLAAWDDYIVSTRDGTIANVARAREALRAALAGAAERRHRLGCAAWKSGEEVDCTCGAGAASPSQKGQSDEGN